MPVPFISYRCLWSSFLPDIDHPDIRLGIVVHIIHAQTRTTDPIHELSYPADTSPVVGCVIPHLCLETFQLKKVRLMELAYFFWFPHFACLVMCFMERVANRLLRNMIFLFLTSPIQTFISFSFSCDRFSSRSFPLMHVHHFSYVLFEVCTMCFLPSQSFVGSHPFGAVASVNLAFPFGVVSLNISC